MSELEDDIARVAALRGKSAEHYISGAWRARTSITQQEFMLLFTGQPVAEVDIAAYDVLPERSRHFIIEFPLHINAERWLLLLSSGVTEERLIELVRLNERTLAASWVRSHYGPSHPGATRPVAT